MFVSTFTSIKASAALIRDFSSGMVFGSSELKIPSLTKSHALKFQDKKSGNLGGLGIGITPLQPIQTGTLVLK